MMAGKHREPARRPKREYEASEYAAFVIRTINGWGARAGEDPAGLAYLPAFEEALRNAANLAIATANQRPDQPYSLAEIASIMGMSRQAVHKRGRLGEAIARLRGQGPVVRLDDMRKARAAALAEAGVPDRTGSPREIAAGPGPEETAS